MSLSRNPSHGWANPNARNSAVTSRSLVRPDPRVEGQFPQSLDPLAPLLDLLRSSSGFQTVSLPLEVFVLLRPVFASLPILSKNLELMRPGPSNLSSGFSILATDFGRFDRFIRLSLPGEALSAPFFHYLARLPFLEELQLDTTNSRIVGHLPRPQSDDFKSLKAIELLGPLSDLPKLLVACSATMIRNLGVKSSSLYHRGEVKEALQAILNVCSGLAVLHISIKELNELEDPTWIDLSDLRQLNLQTIIIKHPRPLPLSDAQVTVFLTAWTRLTHMSLNPKPTHRNVSRGYPLPTLKCLECVFPERLARLQCIELYVNYGPCSGTYAVETC